MITSVSKNTTTPLHTEEPSEEIEDYNSSTSNLDNEVLSAFINPQNGQPNAHYEIGNSFVKPEGLSTKATSQLKYVFKIIFVPKWSLI